MQSTNKPILGFDFGTKRIGVAVGQQLTATATPLPIIEAPNKQLKWQAISDLIAEWQPAALIVGIPLNMDGSEQEMTALAQKFCRQLEGRYNLPVYPVDERLTSVAVKEQIADGEIEQKASERYQQIDSLSAQMILQEWLNSI